MLLPRHALRLSVASVALLVLTGCGGGGSDTAPDESGSDSSGATADEVLRDYFEALADGDAEACDYETESYAAEFNEQMAFFSDDGEVLECPERVKKVPALVEAFGDEGAPNIGETEYEVIDESEGEAVVEATYEDGTTESYGLVYEDGRWLVNEDLSSDGDASADEVTDGDAYPTEMDAKKWNAAWCDVEIGQTRDEAIEVMGEPTGEFTVDDGATPQLNWQLGPYSYTAFFDTDGVVNRFYANYDDLGEADLAALECVEENDFGTLERTDG